MIEIHPKTIKIDDIEYDLVPKKTVDENFIFISDDGKKIYSCDIYWIVCMNENIVRSCTIDAYILGDKDPSVKRFSTEKMAKNYIIMNKYHLSLREVIDAMSANPIQSSDKSMHIHGSNTAKMLEKLIKDKLKF